MNPYLIIGALLAIAGAYFGGSWSGTNYERTRWEAKTYKELAETSTAARKQEAMWQEVVNETEKGLVKKLDGTRRSLDTPLDSLRSRPDRAPGMSEAPRSECAGGNGAELAREHAGFLARYAALAAEQDAGLAACYSALDGVRKR